MGIFGIPPRKTQIRFFAHFFIFFGLKKQLSLVMQSIMSRLLVSFYERGTVPSKVIWGLGNDAEKC